MPNDTVAQEVELDAKQGKIRVRGSDVLTTFGIAAVVLVGYMVWEHKEDSKTTQTAFIGDVREMTAAQRDSVQAQREMNCIISLPQEQRQRDIEFCKRVVR